MHFILENASCLSSQKLRLPLPKYHRFLFADILNAKDKIIVSAVY